MFINAIFLKAFCILNYTVLSVFVVNSFAFSDLCFGSFLGFHIENIKLYDYENEI